MNLKAKPAKQLSSKDIGQMFDDINEILSACNSAVNANTRKFLKSLHKHFIIRRNLSLRHKECLKDIWEEI